MAVFVLVCDCGDGGWGGLVVTYAGLKKWGKGESTLC